MYTNDFLVVGLSETGEQFVPGFPQLPENQIPPCNYIELNSSYVTCTAEDECKCAYR